MNRPRPRLGGLSREAADALGMARAQCPLLAIADVVDRGEVVSLASSIPQAERYTGLTASKTVNV
jgi:hypothetical protein